MKRNLIQGMLLLFALIVCTSSAAAVAQDTVARDLPAAADAGTMIAVNLTVDVESGTPFYAIDETVPIGWTVTSATSGGDYTAEAGHVRWIVTGGAADTVYSYTVLVPADASGTYTFDGIYAFEGVTAEATILGNTTISIGGVVIAITDAAAQPSGTTATQITITNMTNFGATTVTLLYDPTVVQIGSVTAGDAGTPTANIDNTAGTATIAAYVSTTTGPDSPITFANLELLAVGNNGDTSPLTLAITMLSDADENSVNAEPISGVFVIGTIKGDLNSDGTFTPADAVIALQIAVGSRPFDDAADVSGDGRVTSLDALMIMQAAAGARDL